MKIMHIVGNRPQFIKLAPVSRKMRKHGIEETIVHTGQHYDGNMSEIFFEELGIPYPKVNLNVGSDTHAQLTARIISGLERIVIEERPDGVVIYGDTNSTLAAAIVVSKLNITLFHIEAGPRTYNRANPEEKNRIVADHLADYLFAPDKISVENLKKEGIQDDQIIFSGDVMYDAFLYSVSHCDDHLDKKHPKDFILMTWHREENTCSKERMERMLSFVASINCKVVLPLHPRTAKMLSEFNLWEKIRANKNLMVMEPVGYKEMTFLLSRCKFVISDSGGVSKEASFAGKRCFFPLRLEVWPELIEAGYIHIVDLENEESVQESVSMARAMLDKEALPLKKAGFFGDGNAAEIIVNTIEKVLREKNP